jgi:hypothetical protein
MGKNASKNFVNQFKNTRRQAHVEGKKLVKSTVLKQKKFFPGEQKTGKKTDHGDK